MNKPLLHVIFLFIFVWASAPAFAQTDVDADADTAKKDISATSNWFGVKVGQTYSTIDKLISNPKGISTLSYGLVYEHKFNNSWSLGFEPGYMQIGADKKSFNNNANIRDSVAVPGSARTYNSLLQQWHNDSVKSTGSDSSYRLNYVNLPFLVTYYPVTGKFYVGVQAGVAINILVNNSFKHYAAPTSSDTGLQQYTDKVPDPSLVTYDVLAGLRVGYNITDNFTIALAGRASYGLDNIGIALLDRRYKYANAQLQLCYRFK